jgi:hypothetical protein
MLQEVHHQARVEAQHVGPAMPCKLLGQVHGDDDGGGERDCEARIDLFFVFAVNEAIKDWVLDVNLSETCSALMLFLVWVVCSCLCVCLCVRACVGGWYLNPSILCRVVHTSLRARTCYRYHRGNGRYYSCSLVSRLPTSI